MVDLRNFCDTTKKSYIIPSSQKLEKSLVWKAHGIATIE